MKIKDVVAILKALKIKKIAGEKTKVKAIILIIVCTISIMSAVFFFIGKQNLKKDKISLQKELHQLSLSKKELEKVTRGLDESIKLLEEKLQKSEGAVGKLFSQLEEEKKKNVQLTDKITQKEAETAQLTTTVTNYRKDRDALSERLELANEAFDALKSEFDGLVDIKKKSEEKIDKLTRKLKRLTKDQEAASLGTVVVR